MSDDPKSLVEALGMEVVSMSSDRVELAWDVAEKHHQPMGIVHGGVHCAAIETACSIGAGILANERKGGMAAVGLENHTSFIRAVRSGRLRCIALPVTRGNTSQVWQAEILDEADKLVARGTVRLLNVPFDADIG